MEGHPCKSFVLGQRCRCPPLNSWTMRTYWAWVITSTNWQLAHKAIPKSCIQFKERQIVIMLRMIVIKVGEFFHEKYWCSLAVFQLNLHDLLHKRFSHSLGVKEWARSSSGSFSIYDSPILKNKTRENPNKINKQ